MRTLGAEFESPRTYPERVGQVSRTLHNCQTLFRVGGRGGGIYPRVRMRDPGLCCRTPSGQGFQGTQLLR